MDRTIVIGHPKIAPCGQDKVRLSCSVEAPGWNVPPELYFEVDVRYGEGLLAERADAFLVGLLPLVFVSGGRVRCEAPVSAHLLHGLRHELADLLSEFSGSGWALREIDAREDSTSLGGTHVGTGCSCGVDSSAAIALYAGSDTPASLRVDTLTFFNVGSHGDFRSFSSVQRKQVEDLYAARLRRAQAFAAEVGLPLLTVESNLYEFGVGQSHVKIVSFRNAAAVLALGKWFALYHVASGNKASEFAFNPRSVARCEIYLLGCLSTESTRLHSAVGAQNRFERLRLIAGFPPARRNLDVCVRQVGNCISCVKCLRTMAQMELCGVLDEFGRVFDVDWFRKHPWKVAWIMKKDLIYHAEYLQQISKVRALGGRGLPLPLSAYRLIFAWGRLSERISDIRRAFKRIFWCGKERGRR